MSDNKTQASGGVGFFGFLTLLFIGLKLTGYIDWSWWLVLLPFYGPIGIALLVILICFVIAGIAYLVR